MKRKLRTLFYGCTHEHAAGKLNTLRMLKEDYEVVAVVDDRPRGSMRFVDPQCPFDDTGFMLISEAEAAKIDDIDVAFIETTNCDLMSDAGRFVDRGIAMHCDKPCGEAMEPYRTFLEKCRTKNIPFQIGYMYRGNPAIHWIGEKVTQGLLGDVAFVEADMNHDYGVAGYAEYISSFKGGIMYNLGCHLVDLIYPLVRGGFISAFPMIGDAPGYPAGSKTSGAAVLRFEGTDVLLRTAAHMGGGNLVRRLRIDGTNGTLDLCPIERFDGGELKLLLSLKEGRCGCASGRSEVGFGVQGDRYAAQLVDLAAIVRGEKPNDQDYDRDLRVHEMLLRACGIK